MIGPAPNDVFSGAVNLLEPTGGGKIVGRWCKEAYIAPSSTPALWPGQTKTVSTMASGKVKFFNTEKGFGFITPDQGGKDVFVHKTGTREDLYEGDNVNFELEETPKGMNAINVTKA